MVRAVDDQTVVDEVVVGVQHQQQPPPGLPRMGNNRRYRGYHHHQLYGSDRRSERAHPFTGGRGFHHVSGRNLSGGSSSAGSIGGNENSVDLAKNPAAAPVASAASLPFVGHPQLDTNQTFILSGPFPKYDAERGIYVHVFTARPIPTGMTVIATPLRPAAAATNNNNNDSNAATENNLNPTPPPPTTIKIAQEDITQPPPPLHKIGGGGGGDEHAAAAAVAAIAGRISPNVDSAPPSPSPPPQKEGKPKTPCFMYWSARFPEGRMVPLRQPQPPVYFHTGGEPGAKERVEGGVGEEGEDDHF